MNPTIFTIGRNEMNHQEFFDAHAAAGRIGLSSSPDRISRLIGFVQRHVEPDHQPGLWSHAFLLQGKRIDGQHWVIESDLSYSRRHLRLGVQENRLAKYAQPSQFPRLQILDFGLSQQQADAVSAAALDLVVRRIRYSFGECLGGVLAMRHPKLRPTHNPMAREKALFCSSFVREAFLVTGIDLCPGLAVKNTMPSDLAKSPLIRGCWELKN